MTWQKTTFCVTIEFQVMCKFRGLLNALLGWVVHVYLQILLKQETWVYCFIFSLFWLTLILEIILCLCQDWGALEKSMQSVAVGHTFWFSSSAWFLILFGTWFEQPSVSFTIQKVHNCCAKSESKMDELSS